MNILVVTAYPPVLHMHGGGVRMFHNIRILAKRHHVRVISFVESDEERDLLESTRSICDSVTAVTRLPNYSPHWFSLAPFLIHEFDTPEMREAIERDCRVQIPDVIQCEYLQMSQYRRKGIFTLLTLHEILSANAREAFARETNPVEKLRLYHRWMGMLQYEIGAAGKVNRVVTMTENDAQYLRSYLPRSDVRAIPIGIDTQHFHPHPENTRQDVELLFVGNFRHSPNVEAAEFLQRYIRPVFPDLKVTLAGSNVPDHIKGFDGVHLTGYVPDTRSLYTRPNTIVVAPLFSGTGQRVKLLEAFSMALPVVSTSLGVAGFPVTGGQHALIANTGEEFVRAIKLLLSNLERRRDLGMNARKMIVERFDWENIGKEFEALMEGR
jgi:polysaccharide biosynthesis protein PslH